MSSLAGPTSTEEAKASSLLRQGSLAAVAGSLVALAVPTLLVLLAQGKLAGLSSASSGALGSESVLVSVGAVLVLLALFLYRRAFVHLKHVDGRLRPVVTLCWVGSVGAIALVIAGAYVTGASSAISGCLAGHPAQALSCLRSHDPSAGYLAVAGFWLLWAGAAGLSVGLILSGRHFERTLVTAGGVAYAVLVADLAAPFADLLKRIPAIPFVLAVAPVAGVVAAVLVYLGARSTLSRDRASRAP